MRRVEPALEPLEIVRRLKCLRYGAVGRGRARPFVVRLGRRQVRRAEIGPDHTAALDGGIGFEPRPGAERRVGGLGRNLEACARHVELPAVIDAAQPALLVAAEKERRAAVAAIGIDKADTPRAVAEGDQVLAEEPHPHRRAVTLGNFL